MSLNPNSKHGLLSTFWFDFELSHFERRADRRYEKKTIFCRCLEQFGRRWNNSRQVKIGPHLISRFTFSISFNFLHNCQLMGRNSQGYDPGTSVYPFHHLLLRTLTILVFVSSQRGRRASSTEWDSIWPKKWKMNTSIEQPRVCIS